VDWTPHLPLLYTQVMWAFPVPVGTATASVPVTLGATSRASQVFGGKLDQVDDCSKSAAKLALHLLKQPAGGECWVPPPPARSLLAPDPHCDAGPACLARHRPSCTPTNPHCDAGPACLAGHRPSCKLCSSTLHHLVARTIPRPPPPPSSPFPPWPHPQAQLPLPRRTQTLCPARRPPRLPAAQP